MNLSELFHDAVDEIEPADRIEEIRGRVADSPAHAARPWWYAAGGVVLATAAAVTAFAVVGSDGGGDEHDDHVASPSETQLVAAYFIGDTEQGPRLFREFDEVPAGDPLQAALDRIERPASDPDYRTPWTETSFGEVVVHDDEIHVEVGDAVLDDPGADLAVQQVVYTLQAAAQERLLVHFTGAADGEDLGYEAQPWQDVLNHVSISDPAEGEAYEGFMVARGAAYSFEATVGWEIRDEADRVVMEGFTTTLDSTRFAAWETRIDLSDLAPGSYTFEARTDDPAVEPPGPDTDTRTIIVR